MVIGKDVPVAAHDDARSQAVLPEIARPLRIAALTRPLPLAFAELVAEEALEEIVAVELGRQRRGLAVHANRDDSRRHRFDDVGVGVAFAGNAGDDSLASGRPCVAAAGDYRLPTADCRLLTG